MKVLVADDDRVLMELLGAGLRQHGMEVLPAFDVIQAMMTAMNKAPDAILLDINMPGGTGFAALQRLKASAKTGLIPIIAMSASTDEATRAKALAGGAADFLPKPLDVDVVVQRLKRLFEPPS